MVFSFSKKKLRERLSFVNFIDILAKNFNGYFLAKHFNAGHFHKVEQTLFRDSLVPSHILPHFTLSNFDQIDKCVVIDWAGFDLKKGMKLETK